jgi:hypothetical protein
LPAVVTGGGALSFSWADFGLEDGVDLPVVDPDEMISEEVF